MTRRPGLAEWLVLSVWAAITNVYAAFARCWTPNPRRRRRS